MAQNYSETPYEELSKAYFHLANHVLTPAITEELTAGLAEFRELVKKGETDCCDICVEMDTENGLMLLYNCEDDGSEKCEGEPFYTALIGDALTDCTAMLAAMEEKGGAYSYDHALSNWFEDAVPNIAEEAYEGFDVTINVPLVGGDPYLEHFE